MKTLNCVEPEKATGRAAELLEEVKKSLGVVPNIFKSFAVSPTVLEAYLKFSGTLSSGALDNRLKESIAVAVAGFNGCEYCASAHTFIGRSKGVSTDELQVNLNGESLDMKTQSALNFVIELLSHRGKVNSETLEELESAGFSHEEAIEIIAHVGMNIFTNYFNETFKTENDFPPVKVSK